MAESPLVTERILTSHCTPTNGRFVNLVALHTLEYLERRGAARWAANFFRRVQASANYVVDADEIIGNVWEKDMPWTTPGVNERSISIEQAGYAGQDFSQWSDDYSTRMLERCAALVADICRRNNITPRKLTDAQLAAGWDGIIDHAQASRVYRQSDHWDCGPSFPWAGFMNRVKHYYDGGGTSSGSTAGRAQEWDEMASKQEVQDALVEALHGQAGWLRWHVARKALQEKFPRGDDPSLRTSVEIEAAWAAANAENTRKEVRRAEGRIRGLEEKIDALTKAVNDRPAAAVAVEGGGSVDLAGLAEVLRPIIREEIDRTRLGKAA